MKPLSYITAFLESLYPNICVMCQSSASSLVCLSCQGECAFVAPATVAVTRTKFLTVHSLFAYHSRFNVLLHAKYYNQRQLLLAQSELFVAYIAQHNLAFDYIAYVPQHWIKSLQRGGNHMRIIAYGCSGGIPVRDVLQKKHPTSAQAGNAMRVRKKNVLGSFTVPLQQKPAVTGKRILLFDDVYTSGATLKECAKELYKSGAAHVIGLTLCRVM